MTQTLFVENDTFFHRMDPLSKFLWATLVMIWTLYIAVPLVQMAMFLLLLIIGWLLAGIGPWRLVKSIRAFILLGVFMIIFQALVARGQEIIWRWGSLRVTAEGLSAGLNVGMRLIVIVTISTLLAITTDPRRLVVALIEYVHIPYRIAYALYSTLRFIPLMQHDATVILEAQTIRGARLDRSFKSRVRQYISLLIPLIASGIRQASMSAIALDSRAFGYKKTRTNLIKVRIDPIGPIHLCIWLTAFVAYVVLAPQGEARLLY